MSGTQSTFAEAESVRGVSRITKAISLDALAAEPERIRDLPRPALLDAHDRAAVLEARLRVALLASQTGPSAPESDRAVSLEEAAMTLSMTKDSL